MIRPRRLLGAAFLALVLLAACRRETVRSAEDWYAQGKYDRSADEYRQFIRDNPKLPSVPNAYMGLAWSEYHLGRLDEAAEAVEILRTRYPGNYLIPQATYLHATVMFAQNRFVECSNELRDLIRDWADDPVIPEARVLLARSEAALLRYASAAENYQAYLDRYGDGPYAPAALLGRAEALAKLARWREAAEGLQYFVERYRSHPDRARALVDLAHYRFAYAEYDAAERLLLEAVHGYADATLRRKALRELLSLYDATARIDSAAGTAKALMESLDPADDTAANPLVFRLAKYHAARTETSAAMALFDRILRRAEYDSAMHSYALHWMTIHELSGGRREAALKYADEFLRRYPAHPEASRLERMAADIYAAAGRTADARRLLDLSLRRRWLEAPSLEFYRLAALDMDLKDYASAGRVIAEGLARARRAGDTPAMISGLYHSMIIHNLDGNLPRAVEAWWRLKDLAPNYITVAEKVYWDNQEQKFYDENRIPPERRGIHVFGDGRQLKVHVAVFDRNPHDVGAMKLASSLSTIFAASLGTDREMAYVPSGEVRKIDELKKTEEFRNVSQSWFPLRSTIGADWVVHGEIRREASGERRIRLRLRLLRVDYEGIFPFEYVYVMTDEEVTALAPGIVHESIDRLKLYRPDR